MATRAALFLCSLALPVVASAAVASCGARTGLTGALEADAGEEVSLIQDHFVPEEEAQVDAFNNDVPIVNLCPDAAVTLIYVIGISNTLYSFDPSASTFTPIGKINCPAGGSTPFSMAVDREGIAYVVFSTPTPDGNELMATGLFRVSTKTAECKRTSYDPGQNGNETFGMGFVANVGDGGDGGETLFVSQDVGDDASANGVLATIDTETFVLTNVGPFNPTVTEAELTGTGDGRLFAFSPQEMAPQVSTIAQIDPANAQVIGEDPLPGIYHGNGWAFGFWGGNFYTFTAPNDSTVVNRFNPHDKSITQVATIDDEIVGAGVSTCAPQN
jgi:hypothetical protein